MSEARHNVCMHSCTYVCTQVRVDAAGEAVFTRCLIRSEQGAGCVAGPDGLLILRACTIRQCYGDGVLAHNGGSVVCDESTISDCGGTGLRAAYAYNQDTGNETMSFSVDNSVQDTQSWSVTSESAVNRDAAAAENTPGPQNFQHNNKTRTQNMTSFDGASWQGGSPAQSFLQDGSKTRNQADFMGMQPHFDHHNMLMQGTTSGHEYSPGESTPQTQKGSVRSVQQQQEFPHAQGTQIHYYGVNDSMDSAVHVDRDGYYSPQEGTDISNDGYNLKNDQNSMHSGHNSSSINTFSSGSDFAKGLICTKAVLAPLCGVPRIAARKCTVSQNGVYGVLATFGGHCEVEECSVNGNRRHGLSVVGMHSCVAGNKCEISHNGEGGVQVCVCVCVFMVFRHVCMYV
jgi:hypothetical protein